MSGAVGLGVCQGEFVSALPIREIMKKMQRSFSTLVTVAEIPPEGLKGLGTKVIEEED